MSETDYASHCPDFAGYFVAKTHRSESIAFPDRLDSRKLDYSFESLKAIDRYLEYVHRNKDRITDREEANTVVWGGCYIGEVIKKHSERKFHWENYHSYVARHPELKQLVGDGPGSMVLLVDDRDAMTMPLNKVGRFIYEGPENNIHFYASGELENRK